LHTEDAYPNSYYPSKHMLSTCLLESDSPSQFDHPFEGATPN
jgi:hypothetical protein